MKTYNAKLCFYNSSELLEGPCWDKDNGLLYFVSIKGDAVYCLNIETGSVKLYKTDGNVGCAVIRKGKLITAERSGIYERDLDDKNKKFILNVICLIWPDGLVSFRQRSPSYMPIVAKVWQMTIF